MSQSLSSSSSSSLLWSCVVGVPLTIPVVLTIRLLFAQRQQSGAEEESQTVTTTAASSSILAYLMMGFIGYVATVRLVPHIKQYTLRKGIFGKDLGKRGTATADVPM
jgi:small-conductance mechanosensitive channel